MAEAVTGQQVDGEKAATGQHDPDPGPLQPQLLRHGEPVPQVGDDAGRAAEKSLRQELRAGAVFPQRKERGDERAGSRFL